MDIYMSIIITQNEAEVLRDIAAEAIGVVFYNKGYEKKLAKIFGLKALAHSFVNNLKDSLYHFKVMDNIINDAIKNNNSDFSEVFIQFKHLEEHLVRGLVDLYVGIFQATARYCTAYIMLLLNDKSNYVKNPQKLIKLYRHNLHICKNHIYELRVKRLDLFIKTDTCLSFNEKYLEGITTTIKDLLFSQIEINSISKSSTENTKYLENLNATVLQSALYGGKMCQIKKNTSIHTITYPTSVTEKEFRKLNPHFMNTAVGETLPIHYWYVIPK